MNNKSQNKLELLVSIAAAVVAGAIGAFIASLVR